MLLFYINASADVPADIPPSTVAADEAMIHISFTISEQTSIETSILESVATRQSPLLKALFEDGKPDNEVIPIRIPDLPASPEEHRHMLESVVIPILNGIAPTVDWRTISGEAAVVVRQYLAFLNITPQKYFGPVKWVEALDALGVEVSNSDWAVKFLRHSPTKRLLIDLKAPEEFLQNLIRSPGFKKITKGGDFSLSLQCEKNGAGTAVSRSMNGQAMALQKLSEHFNVICLLGFKADQGSINALAHMPSLSELSLLSVNNAHAGLLARALPALIALKRLEIEGEYRDAGVLALAPVLQALPQLTHLTVRGWYGDAGALALVPTLQALPQLTHLNICGWYGAAGVLALVPALQALPQLTHLKILGAGDAGRVAIPHLKIRFGMPRN